jgi:hypothetical protein
MTSPSQRQPARQTCLTLLICAIPLLTALLSVLVTTMVFSDAVPGLTKGFPSASEMDIREARPAPRPPEYR